MNQHRSLLAWLLTLVLGVVLWGGGCANGGGSSAGPGDDGGNTDGTTPITDGSTDANPCGAGKIKCPSGCIDPSTDGKNCGKCGTVCAAGTVCSQGMCAAGCSGGETMCGGPSEAGVPEAAAPPIEAGAAGEGGASDGGQEAAAPVADSGAPASDDGGSVAPYCANLGNDPQNCGSCGFACPPSQSCVNGACMLISCPTGQVGCPASGTCIPVGTCCQSGSCTVQGEVCPSPGGMCSCPSGEHACTGPGTPNECISNDACCTTADCKVAGQSCPTPGQPCTCKAGLQCCVATDCPAEPHVKTSACETNPANTCAVVACDPGCYDLDSKFADGCECCVSIYGKTCSAATAGGALTVGGAAVTYTGTIPQVGGSSVGDWFSVSFSGESNTAFHGLIQLTAGAGEFVFDIVQGSCSGAPMGCGEGGTCTAKTAWEESYAGPNPPADPASYPVTGSHFQPIAAIGTVFVHVYRASASAPATCNSYTLTLQE